MTQLTFPGIVQPTKWTGQQESIFAAIQDGDRSLAVIARAGTGKSSTCLEAMGRLSRDLRIGYAAFNVSIAKEFEKKAPKQCSVATSHSLGLAVLRDAVGKTIFNQHKTADLAEVIFPNGDAPRNAARALALTHVVELAKDHLLAPDDPRLKVSIQNMHLEKDDAAAVMDAVPVVLERSREDTATHDFSDMIWQPVVLGLRSRKPLDVLFIDECQDWNPAQHRLALDVLCPGGRVALVGDPRQSIYAFRGADPKSMANMVDALERGGRGVREYPLTVTWRCPTSHVSLANMLVPDLEPAPNAESGEILQMSERAALSGLRAGHMVLCRTNAPLVAACYQLLGQGIRAKVRGRDIGRGLLVLTEKLKPRNIPDLIGRLDDFRVRETDRLTRLRHPGTAIMAMQDKVDCVVVLSEGCQSVDELKGKIKQLFTDVREKNSVTLSTVHKAKGLERDTIIILRPDLMPHPMAKTPSEKQQEENLLYVAVTRSKRRLIFAGKIPSILRGA